MHIFCFAPNKMHERARFLLLELNVNICVHVQMYTVQYTKLVKASEFAWCLGNKPSLLIMICLCGDIIMEHVKEFNPLYHEIRLPCYWISSTENGWSIRICAIYLGTVNLKIQTEMLPKKAIQLKRAPFVSCFNTT